MRMFLVVSFSCLTHVFKGNSFGDLGGGYIIDMLGTNTRIVSLNLKGDTQIALVIY